jgi:hypothetical protein
MKYELGCYFTSLALASGAGPLLEPRVRGGAQGTAQGCAKADGVSTRL